MSFSKNKNYQLLQLYHQLPADVRGHSVRVSVYMQILLEQVLLSAPELCPKPGTSSEETLLDFIREVGFYHDIGKLMVPKEILCKHGRLTPAEYREAERHTLYTETLLVPFLQTARAQDRPFLRSVIEVGVTHHERWDGTGYPHGLRGAEIPFYARLCAVADAYDAMLSRRVYSPSFSSAHAVREIERCSGTQFDPALAEIFPLCAPSFQAVSDRRK